MINCHQTDHIQNDKRPWIARKEKDLIKKFISGNNCVSSLNFINKLI